MLKRKIIDKDIDLEELVDEDRMAVLIFLRNTAFGSEYSYKIIDGKTGKDFDVSFDLSELSFKEFNLEPNENGEFKYTTNISKIDITFKFLTKKQEKEIEQIEKSWNGVGAPPIITKQLEFMIKSVAGNKDPMNIRNFIENLPIKDSQDFRKYVRENRPAIDLKKEVMTPSGENIQIVIGFGVEFFALSTEYRKGQLDEILYLIRRGFSYGDILSMPISIRRYYVSYIQELENK